MPRAAASPAAHLYVHVPFCAAKCQYCAFYSAPARSGQMVRYVAAIETELRRFRKDRAPVRPQTVFFGGGTPTLLTVASLTRLLAAIQPLVRSARRVEWTVESNPATVSAEKARALRAHGVNRISLGVQSFDDTMLNRLGRIHTADQARRTYRLLRRAGFDNINLDLMFGLPGQTVDQWRQTLEQAIALEPDHLSAYCLALEEDTPLWALGQQGILRPDDDRDRAMFELTIDVLTAAGYRHYEISNYARPGRECRHNLAYWQGRDYLGLGPSAWSTVRSTRWQNLPDTDGYLTALAAGRAAVVAASERLSPATKAAERAAFGLRMAAGVSASGVARRWRSETARLLANGLLEKRGARLRLTRRGLLFADEVAAEFV